ncbi:uncharacterized protein LOC108249154 [Kryptolebias marmoratus]|uniref:uncharacterized protein LOC108249154 n=1 Tax=Kryptolebias marmoratus TaxID=37003 RepID=UPI000D52F609|nr:uncharacterized protein LOC108249154 [Kryptolebias marmoratus]
MKLRLVCLLLGVSVLLLLGTSGSAASLDISPNLQQFFSGQSVSLSCPEDGQETGRSIRRSRGGRVEECGAAASGFGVLYGSTCVLDLLSSYTGLYWCETHSGRRSEQVNLTVTRREDTAFALEIPALPVPAGSDVTLRCRYRNGSAVAAYFFRDRDNIGSMVTSHVLQEVQQSDEGLYWCSTDTFGSSPRSFLRVKDPPPPPPSSTSFSPPDQTDPLEASPPPLPPSSPPPPPPPSALQLLRHLLVICPYCVCTVLLASICCRRTSGNQPAPSTETAPPTEKRDDIATEHDF